MSASRSPGPKRGTDALVPGANGRVPGEHSIPGDSSYEQGPARAPRRGGLDPIIGHLRSAPVAIGGDRHPPRAWGWESFDRPLQKLLAPPGISNFTNAPCLRPRVLY